MFQIVFSVIFAIAAVFVPRFLPERAPSWTGWVARGVCGFIALFLVFSTSFVYIDQDKTGHKNKIYGSKDLAGGAIIAYSGEKGPQADIITPGFHFDLLLNVINEVDATKSIATVPEGKYGYLMARDGKPLRPDQTYADAFGPETSERMVNDAAFFLKNGGQKGPQTSVLTPGKYRLNRYLWDIKLDDVTEIPVGFVGVIKSNVWTHVDFGNLKSVKPASCAPTMVRDIKGGALAVPLVPVGCIGIWDRALSPGQYYVNKSAYTVIQVDTRVQTWEYKGGYKHRIIDLTVNQKGDIEQKERQEDVPVPKDAADRAVFLKVEGWDVPQELRVLVQVTPDNAPFVVASVGGLNQIEDRILTPAIRSIIRNVAGGMIKVTVPVLDKDKKPVLDDKGKAKTQEIMRPTLVMDLIEHRPEIEETVEEIIRPEGLKAAVDIKEVRLGDPAIPPELLVARQREQLAQQLKKAYIEEQGAQTQRVATEQARATADQQSVLVRAEILLKSSIQTAQALKNEGMGERDKLNMVAEGQKAQAAVLGEDRVVELRKFEMTLGQLLAFFDKHPEVLTTALANAHKFVPERVFTMGDAKGGGLPGAAAILGDLIGSGTSKPPATTPQKK
ncbi:MAG: SPFH domain-containing protein [Patescibacteria group bacterium]